MISRRYLAALSIAALAWAAGAPAFVTAALAQSGSDAGQARGRLLRSTDDDTVGWLVLERMGVEAPIDRWAQAMVRVGTDGVTEFNYAEHLRAAKAGIERTRDGARGYDRMRLTLNSRLSEYDATYEEFYLNAFSPSMFVTYRPFSRRKPNPLEGGVKLIFTNADDAFVLSVPPVEAEALVGRLGPGRQLTVDIEVTIEEVNATRAGAEILASIDRYSLLSGSGNARALKKVTLN
ncbi:MAG: hypothetical protein V2I25_13085 [Woeseiaceae bacterium]|nr:hypothetical protein [Woeseiaceae bacterium]